MVMNTEYELVSSWAVACSRTELWDVLDHLLDTDDPMVWWPSVDVTGYDGRSMTLRARSGFGYALTFTLHDLDAERPDLLTFSATGDLRGTGRVTFRDVGAGGCAMDIVWRVDADRPWMRRTGWLLRPVFVAGHRLVMRKGERQLNGWIAGS